MGVWACNCAKAAPATHSTLYNSAYYFIIVGWLSAALSAEKGLSMEKTMIIKERLALFFAKTFYGRLVIFFIWAAVPVLFSYSLWAKEERHAIEESVVSYIQVLMSLDKKYNGDINGVCDNKTITSIYSYAEKIHTPACNATTRDAIRDIVVSNMGLQQGGLQSIELANTDVIRKDLNSTIETVEKLSAAIPQHFEDQFRSLATIGVTTMMTSLSIIIAGVAFLGNVFIKDQVKAAHDKEVSQTRDKLLSMIDIARSEISAHTFTTIGNYCTNLYVPLTEPRGKHKYLYETYIMFATSMTEFAYKSAAHLKKLSEDNPGEKLSVQQLGIVERCLNNYAYFLAERSALDGNKNADWDKVQLGALLGELQKLSKKGATELLSWNLRDTIGWVKLHIGGKERAGVESILDELLSDPTIPKGWRESAKARYETHKQNNHALWVGQTEQIETHGSKDT